MARLVVPAVLLAATACGLPGDTDVRVVDDGSVPYRLLDPEPSPARGDADEPVPQRTPVVFWLRADDRLAPAAVPASCTDAPESVVATLLVALGAGPDEGARSAGRSSAIPASSDVRLDDLTDGLALVALDPASSISADRLPRAIGQLVLTVTSAPGVETVRVTISGDAVEVPLPGGALTARPVSAADYAALLPDRYLGREEPPTLARDIGCHAAAAPTT